MAAVQEYTHEIPSSKALIYFKLYHVQKLSKRSLRVPQVQEHETPNTKGDAQTQAGWWIFDTKCTWININIKINTIPFDELKSHPDNSNNSIIIET